MFGRERSTTKPQAAEGILDLVEKGRLAPVRQLPSDRELARLLGIGRRDVRRGVKVLLEHGLLEIRRHNRVFISRSAGDPEVISSTRSALSG